MVINTTCLKKKEYEFFISIRIAKTNVQIEWRTLDIGNTHWNSTTINMLSLANQIYHHRFPPSIRGTVDYHLHTIKIKTIWVLIFVYSYCYLNYWTYIIRIIELLTCFISRKYKYKQKVR